MNIERRRPRWLALRAAMLAAALAGCGGSPPAVGFETVVGPHHGSAPAIDGGWGYAEYVLEPAPADAKPDERVLAVYFLGRDGKSPMSRLPDTASAVIDRIGPSTVDIQLALKPDPRADDPAGAGRFASPPTRFAAPAAKAARDSNAARGAAARKLGEPGPTGHLDLRFGSEEVQVSLFVQSFPDRTDAP
jgi:hypothetical protein